MNCRSMFLKSTKLFVPVSAHAVPLSTSLPVSAPQGSLPFPFSETITIVVKFLRELSLPHSSRNPTQLATTVPKAWLLADKQQETTPWSQFREETRPQTKTCPSRAKYLGRASASGPRNPSAASPRIPTAPRDSHPPVPGPLHSNSYLNTLPLYPFVVKPLVPYDPA